jgi:CxxC motif-containing protein (DUF1111 family)
VSLKNYRIFRRLLVLAILLAGTPLKAGPFSVEDRTFNAFGHPYPSVTVEENRLFHVGNSIFRDNWVRAPSTTKVRDGLGPTFNANTCSACHELDGRGEGAAKLGFPSASLLFRIENIPGYGGQLNPLSIDGVPPEVVPNVEHALVPGLYADGTPYELRRPIYTFSQWLYGAPPATSRISPRVGQQVIGVGLLERIPADEIEAQADPDDKNQDGISGRTIQVLNLRTGQIQLGRFGWKSEQPTVEQQSAGALVGDIGVTNPLFPEENCPAPQVECQNAINGGAPEADERVLSRLVFYMTHLAVPTRRDPESAEFLEGEKVFQRIGCASCHTPSYQIDGNAIYPYTDMLLHDMGAELADRDLGGNALPTEWRTPPLWGIGLIHVVNKHTNLLHDGRARGVAEAVLWHGGEGERAREAFRSLSQLERDRLVKFVNSL